MFYFRNIFFGLFLTFCLMSFSSLLAQQDAQITHNMFNKFMYNPAIAGAYPELHATLLHRSQWVGIDGAPTTSNLNEERWQSKLSGIFYYVHSYAITPKINEDIAAVFEHGNAQYVGAIYKRKLLGVQFHPEKSQEYGLELIKAYFSYHSKK